LRFLFFDDCENVASAKKKVLNTVVLNFGAAVLGVDNNVADFNVKRNPLFAVFIETTWPYCDDLALLWLLMLTDTSCLLLLLDLN